MYLDEFYNYKNQLMNDILTNKTIVRLLSDDCKTMEDPKSLVYTQVFPYEYVPETIAHGRTYICCDVDIQSVESKTYLFPTIYIWVFTHKSLMRLPEGGVRVDKLCSEIARKINGSRYYGLGELEFYSSRRFAPVTDYLGKELIFQTTDFNRQSPSGRSVPTNRRHH
jgi:hypothetical protein